MKDFNFRYKVSDILRHPETPETIQFSNKFSTMIPHCSDEGISGTIILQGLNDNQMQIVLSDIHCACNGQCDKCGKDISINLHSYPSESIAEFQVKHKKKKREQNQIEPDVYIDEKDEMVDLEELIVADLRLSESVVNLCQDCQKTVENTSEKEVKEENV